MSLYGMGSAFALAASMDYRSEIAKKTLLQPDIQVKYLGAATDGFNVTFGRFEVVSKNGSTRTIQAAPCDIEMVRNDPAYSQSLHTVLCQAQYKIQEFKDKEALRQQQEWDNTKASIKSWVRKNFLF